MPVSAHFGSDETVHQVACGLPTVYVCIHDIAGAPEPVRQVRRLPDQCFHRPENF